MDHSPTRKRCASPDVICPICLAEISNKAVADSCSHSFCFACLSEWSKAKPECPLCKQKFSVIKHTFTSERDYKEYRIGPPVDVTRAAHVVIDVAVHRAMGFMTTMRMSRNGGAPVLFWVPPEEVSQLRRASQILSSPHSTSEIPRSETTSSSVEFRRSVYQRNLWVKPTKRGRMRRSSPEFYRENPTELDRLIPWLTRELSVTTSSPFLEYACLNVIGWIKEYHILSYAFKRFVRIYFGANTDHFVHEFHNFATSPLDLIAYDVRSQYSETETPTSENVSSETDDSDSGVNDSDDSDLIEIKPATSSSNLIADASNSLQSTSTGITAGPSSSPPNVLTSHKRPAFFRPPYSDSSNSDEDFVPSKKSKISE